MGTLITSSAATANMPATATESMWYAVCTLSRHEKCAAEHLRQRDVEYFLPLYETVHRWNNGRHRLQLPLFPGYLFVHIALRDKLRVLQVPGLAHFVSFGGVPAELPQADIDSLRNALTSGAGLLPHPYLTVGAQVEICRGPLAGMKGILLRHQGKYRVVLSVDLIMRSVVVEVESADIVPVNDFGSLSGAGHTLATNPCT